MLNVIILNAVMLSVIMLNVAMLNVLAPLTGPNTQGFYPFVSYKYKERKSFIRLSPG